jgi:hypothetical protein
MEQDLILKGLAPTTRRNYLLYCRKFAAHYGRSPEELRETEIREYLLHLIQVEQVSYATYRQIIAALKFLYRVTLNREMGGHLNHIVREFAAYYHSERPHQALGNEPLLKLSAAEPIPGGEIVCEERLGGLLKHYVRRAVSAAGPASKRTFHFGALVVRMCKADLDAPATSRYDFRVHRTAPFQQNAVEPREFIAAAAAPPLKSACQIFCTGQAPRVEQIC